MHSQVWSRRDVLRFALALPVLGAFSGCATSGTRWLGYGEAGLGQIPAGTYAVTRYEPPGRGLDARFLYLLTPVGQPAPEVDQVYGTQLLGRLSLAEIRAAVKAQPLKSVEEPRAEAILDPQGQVVGYLIIHRLDCTIQVAQGGGISAKVREGGEGWGGGGAGGGGGRFGGGH